MIEVYAVDISRPPAPERYEHFLTFVSPDKSARIRRFYRMEDRLRGLVADILIRDIIIRKTGIPNKDIEFYTNDYGKPFLKCRDEFQFNLSHSGIWVVAVVDNQPVGIDVEQIQPIDLDISRNYYSPDEHRELMSKDDKFSYFFTLWSLKESYIKIVGKGLSLPLNSFSITFFGPDDIRIKAEGQLLDDIFFRQYHVHKDYKMAVCGRHRDFPTEITLKTTDQLFDEFIENYEKQWIL